MIEINIVKPEVETKELIQLKPLAAFLTEPSKSTIYIKLANLELKNTALIYNVEQNRTEEWHSATLCVPLKIDINITAIV